MRLKLIQVGNNCGQKSGHLEHDTRRSLNAPGRTTTIHAVTASTCVSLTNCLMYIINIVIWFYGAWFGNKKKPFKYKNSPNFGPLTFSAI